VAEGQRVAQEGAGVRAGELLQGRPGGGDLGAHQPHPELGGGTDIERPVRCRRLAPTILLMKRRWARRLAGQLAGVVGALLVLGFACSRCGV
jgi:hypothetical protein